MNNKIGQISHQLIIIKKRIKNKQYPHKENMSGKTFSTKKDQRYNHIFQNKLKINDTKHERTT